MPRLQQHVRALTGLGLLAATVLACGGEKKSNAAPGAKGGDSTNVSGAATGAAGAALTPRVSPATPAMHDLIVDPATASTPAKQRALFNAITDAYERPENTDPFRHGSNTVRDWCPDKPGGCASPATGSSAEVQAAHGADALDSAAILAVKTGVVLARIEFKKLPGAYAAELVHWAPVLKKGTRTYWWVGPSKPADAQDKSISSFMVAFDDRNQIALPFAFSFAIWQHLAVAQGGAERTHGPDADHQYKVDPRLYADWLCADFCRTNMKTDTSSVMSKRPPAAAGRPTPFVPGEPSLWVRCAVGCCAAYK